MSRAPAAMTDNKAEQSSLAPSAPPPRDPTADTARQAEHRADPRYAELQRIRRGGSPPPSTSLKATVTTQSELTEDEKVFREFKRKVTEERIQLGRPTALAREKARADPSALDDEVWAASVASALYSNSPAPSPPIDMEAAIEYRRRQALGGRVGLRRHRGGERTNSAIVQTFISFCSNASESVLSGSAHVSQYGYL